MADNLVYEIVEKIPRGKVMTYGVIARIVNCELRIRNMGKQITPRYVGYLLHNNPDPENIPCHRVVNSKGELAKNYKYGSWKQQKRKLLEEGAVFKGDSVDLEKSLWNVNNIRPGPGVLKTGF